MKRKRAIMFAPKQVSDMCLVQPSGQAVAPALAINTGLGGFQIQEMDALSNIRGRQGFYRTIHLSRNNNTPQNSSFSLHFLQSFTFHEVL